jgi:hypothetical protein
MSERLDTFVRDALARGAERDAIRATLINAGWPEGEIDAALGAWTDTPFGVPAPRRRVQTSAREAFLYLVMFATMYVVAFNVGALLFAWVERLLPDPAAPDFWQGRLAGVRGSTAAVLIAFPVFLALARHMGGILKREPEKRASGVRRWLTYLTLFLAAIVLIGNLVVVVTGMLSGELTARFLLKSLVVFLTAGAVFGHYFTGIRGDEADAPRIAPSRGLIAVPAGVAIALTAALGLWMSGTPGAARSEALDERRTRELQEISNAVNAHAFRFKELPATLEVMRASDPGTRAPDLRDPISGEPYGYRVIDATRYELCATFERAVKESPAARAYGDWRHPAGPHCYTLVVPAIPPQ